MDTQALAQRRSAMSRERTRRFAYIRTSVPTPAADVGALHRLLLRDNSEPGDRKRRTCDGSQPSGAMGRVRHRGARITDTHSWSKVCVRARSCPCAPCPCRARHERYHRSLTVDTGHSFNAADLGIEPVTCTSAISRAKLGNRCSIPCPTRANGALFQVSALSSDLRREGRKWLGRG